MWTQENRARYDRNGLRYPSLFCRALVWHRFALRLDSDFSLFDQFSLRLAPVAAIGQAGRMEERGLEIGEQFTAAAEQLLLNYALRAAALNLADGMPCRKAKVFRAFSVNSG